MTPDYFFQHRVLRDMILRCDPDKLKKIIDTKDKDGANALFGTAYDIVARYVDERFWHVHYDIRFEDLGSKKAFRYNFLTMTPCVPECYSIFVLVEKGKIFYFTVEFGEDHPAIRFGNFSRFLHSEEEIMERPNHLFLCRWDGEKHVNYKPFSRDPNNVNGLEDIKAEIERIVNRE